MKYISLTSIALAAILCSPTSFAEEGGKKKPRKGPPAAAFAVCENLNEGASCSFTAKRKKALQGSCAKPRGDRLVCVPKGHKRGKKMRDQAE